MRNSAIRYSISAKTASSSPCSSCFLTRNFFKYSCRNTQQFEITAEPRSHNQDELASTCSPTQQALLTNRSIPSPLPETATKSRKTSESGDSGTAAIAMKGSHPKDLEASASGKERKYIRVSTEHSERAEMAFITSPKQSLDLSNFDYSEDQFS